MTSDLRPAGPGRGAGSVAAGFEPVQQRFEEQLRADPEHSAQLVVLAGDEVVVDLWGGPLLGPDSVTGVYSATKGIAALAVALLLQDGALELDESVAMYWPEFGARRKDGITVRQLLTHRAGLTNTERGLTPAEFLDPAHAAALLADTAPAWRPGAAFGYHALTIGPLVEELVRRVTGDSLQQLWERRVRAPRGIDFHLGLPEQQEQRFVPLRPTSPPHATRDVRDAEDHPAHALGLSDAVSPNIRAMRAAGSASIGGTGSARGLAHAYAAGVTGGDPLLGPATLDAVSQLQVDGPDLVLSQHMRFGVLFMKPRPASPWGSWRAIGHDGAAGALAFADPTDGVAFGYVPNPMPQRGGADVRAIELAGMVRACLRERTPA